MLGGDFVLRGYISHGCVMYSSVNEPIVSAANFQPFKIRSHSKETSAFAVLFNIKKFCSEYILRKKSNFFFFLKHLFHISLKTYFRQKVQ